MSEFYRPLCPCHVYTTKSGSVFTLTRPDCPSRECQRLQVWQRQREMERRERAVRAEVESWSADEESESDS
jgi:hypothetical protein